MLNLQQVARFFKVGESPPFVGYKHLRGILSSSLFFYFFALFFYFFYFFCGFFDNIYLGLVVVILVFCGWVFFFLLS